MRGLPGFVVKGGDSDLGPGPDAHVPDKIECIAAIPHVINDQDAAAIEQCLGRKLKYDRPCEFATLLVPHDGSDQDVVERHALGQIPSRRESAAGNEQAVVKPSPAEHGRYLVSQPEKLVM